MNANYSNIRMFRHTDAGQERFYLYVELSVDGLYQKKSVSVSSSSNSDGQYEVRVVFVPFFRPSTTVVPGKVWMLEELSAHTQLDFNDEAPEPCVVKVDVIVEDGRQTSVGGGVLSQTNAETATRPIVQDIL